MTSYKCKFQFGTSAEVSSKHSKQESACEGMVDGLQTVPLKDDSGNMYAGSGIYLGNGHCQLFFTKSDCAVNSSFFMDSSHAPVQSYQVKCKEN
ncbi:MAG: hypothetical protein AAFS07_18730 [Pseudomonadota bacterium]